jgi:uncharacterized membrane protein YphA (DoxX/SURF4 family)
MKRKTAIEIIVALVMFLFLYATSSKLMEYKVFEAQLGRSPMTTRIAGYLAWLVPGTEIIISALLAIPRARLLGLYASFSLMSAFTAYISIMLMFSPSLPCSCGGVLSHMEWNEHLMFNIGVTVLCGVGVLLQVRELKTESNENFANTNPSLI